VGHLTLNYREGALLDGTRDSQVTGTGEGWKELHHSEYKVQSGHSVMLSGIPGLFEEAEPSAREFPLSAVVCFQRFRFEEAENETLWASPWWSWAVTRGSKDPL